jgi:hypothetical protein
MAAAGWALEECAERRRGRVQSLDRGGPHLVVRRERVRVGHLGLLGAVLADHFARLVHRRVLVERVDVHLQVLGRLGKAEGVKAAVTCTREATVMTALVIAVWPSR